MLRFVDVDSQFHPNIEAIYMQRITTWAQSRQAKLWLEPACDDEGV